MPNQSYDWVTFDDDESVIWEGQPRVESIIKTAIALLIGALIAGVVSRSVVIGGGAVALAAGITAVSYMDIQNTDYVLTNKRLYRKTGSLSESTESAPLSKIQNTSLSKGIIGSSRGFGTVSVSTAAGAGDIRISNINNPSAFKQKLTAQLAEANDQSTGDTSSEAQGATVDADAVADELKRFRENLEAVNGGGD